MRDDAGRGGTRRDEPDEAGRGGTLPLRGSVWKLGILKVSVKQQRSVLRAASENLIKLSFPPHAFEIVCARYAQQVAVIHIKCGRRGVWDPGTLSVDSDLICFLNLKKLSLDFDKP